MPSFPHPGSVTICEINSDLNVADSLFDDRAKEIYGTLLGMVFSPVQFPADQFLGHFSDLRLFQGFIRGPGDSPKPLAFSFQNNFKVGALLSVCWSCGHCCTYPLVFRSHILPP